jgi:hypothetical protein
MDEKVCFYFGENRSDFKTFFFLFTTMDFCVKRGMRKYFEVEVEIKTTASIDLKKVFNKSLINFTLNFIVVAVGDDSSEGMKISFITFERENGKKSDKSGLT